MSKKCPNCSRTVNGHKNKKFCGQQCKDRYHNITNPRGYYAPEKRDWHEAAMDDMELGWDGHKVWTS
jgi:hypothetical protein